MKLLLSVVAAFGALAATDASAQGVDLSGPYRCVQMCQEGLPGPAFVSQRGWDLNLVNEAGVPSRAWIDRPGHIWAPGWNQGAIYAPDGMIIQFDGGTVWQRDLGEPELVPVPRGKRRVAVAPPPVESVAPPPRAAAPAERAAPLPPPPRAAAPVERTAVARNAFDGPWSVVISTQSGPCDPQYRFGVQIINGNIVYDGGGAVNAQGRVAPNGSVSVSVSSGGQSASGQGRLSREGGGGSWRGQGPGGTCAGTWQAARRG